MLSAIAFVKDLIPIIAAIYAGVEAAVPVAKKGLKTLERMIDERREPTADEWADLNEYIAQRRRKLHSDSE